MPNIIKLPRPPKLERRLRVAAYARVSSGKDAMLHSLSAQVSYYSKLIQAHPGWLYCGVYADEALSGTKDNRDNFLLLLEDCRAGKLDLVITKSISRFARNTVTLLETVRELKFLGVDVFFEEQNIHTMSGGGELMLTILASYAQEESLSVSENQKWRVRRNFEEGKVWNCTMLGYRGENGQLIIVPEEAEVVRRIYRDYLSGMGLEKIMNTLNAEEIPPRFGSRWCTNAVRVILKNYAYTGNVLLQTTYRENHITKRKKINHGEMAKYHAAGTHEAIIDMATFEAVQEEFVRRAEKHPKCHTRHSFPFTGKLVCAVCGKHYRRKVKETGPVWICSTYNTQGKAACPSKAVPEVVLEALTEGQDVNAIDSITVQNGNLLTFHLADGTEWTEHWQDLNRRRRT